MEYESRESTVLLLMNPSVLGWSSEKAKYWEQNIYNSVQRSSVTYKEAASAFIQNTVTANGLIQQGAMM